MPQTEVLPLHHIPHIEQEPRKPARPYPTPRTRLVSFSVDTFGTFTDIHGFLSALVRHLVVSVIESLLNLLPEVFQTAFSVPSRGRINIQPQSYCQGYWTHLYRIEALSALSLYKVW